MPDVAPPEAGAGETPPVAVPAAGGEAPGGTPTVPDAGGTGVDPLLGRLKAVGVSDNDLDQVQRYYGSVDEVRGFKTRVSELESDTYKDRVMADAWMADVDPEILEAHEAYREKWTDKVYNEAMKKQARELAAERPAETQDEELGRRLDRLEKAEKTRSASATQAERQKAFDGDLSEIIGGMKLKKEVADFLREDIRQSRDDNIQNATQLADFAQKRLARVTGLIASESKAAPPAPVVAETPPPPSTDEDKAGFGDDGEPKTVKDIMKDVLDTVGGSTEEGSGAS